jgi:hypothetical protein
MLFRLLLWDEKENGPAPKLFTDAEAYNLLKEIILDPDEDNQSLAVDIYQITIRQHYKGLLPLKNDDTSGNGSLEEYWKQVIGPLEASFTMADKHVKDKIMQAENYLETMFYLEHEFKQANIEGVYGYIENILFEKGPNINEGFDKALHSFAHENNLGKKMDIYHEPIYLKCMLSDIRLSLTQKNDFMDRFINHHDRASFNDRTRRIIADMLFSMKDSPHFYGSRKRIEKAYNLYKEHKKKNPLLQFIKTKR